YPGLRGWVPSCFQAPTYRKTRGNGCPPGRELIRFRSSCPLSRSRDLPARNSRSPAGAWALREVVERQRTTMIRFKKHLWTNIKRCRNLPRLRGKGAAMPRTRLCLEALEGRLVPSGNNWSMYNFDAAGTRDNRAEHILSPDNVGGLQML